jgi:hypothetical protein
LWIDYCWPVAIFSFDLQKQHYDFNNHTCKVVLRWCNLSVGYTLNIMTLGAIAAAIGLIIDDAIVVVNKYTEPTKNSRRIIQAAGTKATSITCRPHGGSS